MLTKPPWYFLLRLLMTGKQMNYSAAFSGIFKRILCFMPVGYFWSSLIFTLMQWSLVAILYSNLYNASYLADLREWFWTLLTKWLRRKVCFYNTIKIYFFFPFEILWKCWREIQRCGSGSRIPPSFPFEAAGSCSESCCTRTVQLYFCVTALTWSKSLYGRRSRYVRHCGSDVRMASSAELGPVLGSPV